MSVGGREAEATLGVRMRGCVGVEEIGRARPRDEAVTECQSWQTQSST